MEYFITKTHINNIVSGDTIFYRGKIRTVSNSDIKYSNFMGKSIFGDTFKLGYVKVQKVNFKTVRL